MLHRDRGKNREGGFYRQARERKRFRRKERTQKRDTGKALYVKACGALFYGCARRLRPLSGAADTVGHKEEEAGGFPGPMRIHPVGKVKKVR